MQLAAARALGAGRPAGARRDRRRAGPVRHLRPPRRRRAVLEASTKSACATAPTCVVEGYDFAPTFSIWTTIEECLNPPLIWERERGFYTTAPFSEPEVFEFPEGIGPVECVNVEHEEVVLIPRWVECERVTFKYGLGEEFIERAAHPAQTRASTRPSPSACAGTQVAPRDVVAAALPDPATLGDRMTGRTCAGTGSPAWALTAGRAPPISTTSLTTSSPCGSTAVRRSFGRRHQSRCRAGAARSRCLEGPRRPSEAFPARAVPGSAAEYGAPHGAEGGARDRRRARRAGAGRAPAAARARPAALGPEQAGGRRPGLRAGGRRTLGSTAGRRTRGRSPGPSRRRRTTLAA